MAAAGSWAVLDELGYLESGCADFQQSVLDLLKVCRVLAVVRKQDTPFLRALCADPDAFAGVVMTRPGLTFPDGKPQQLPLRRCNVRAMVYRQLPCLRFWAKYNDRYLMADKDLTKPTEIEFCTGSFSAVDTIRTHLPTLSSQRIS